MKPILLSWGDIHLMSYGVFTTIGYAVGAWYLYAHRREMEVTKENLVDFVLCAILGALVGGRVGALLAYSEHSWSQVWIELIHLRGGISFYHGFWTACLSGFLYCRIAGKNAARIADVCGVAVPLAHAFGRVGCLLAGCCYGKPTDMPWGMAYTGSHVPEAARGVPLHPTQLYEAAACLLIAAIIHHGVRKKNLRAGSAFWIYVLSYAAMRFFVDALREGDTGRLMWVLRTGQWDAVFSLSLAAVFFFWTSRRVSLEAA